MRKFVGIFYLLFCLFISCSCSYSKCNVNYYDIVSNDVSVLSSTNVLFKCQQFLYAYDSIDEDYFSGIDYGYLSLAHTSIRLYSDKLNSINESGIITYGDIIELYTLTDNIVETVYVPLMSKALINGSMFSMYTLQSIQQSLDLMKKNVDKVGNCRYNSYTSAMLVSYFIAENAATLLTRSLYTIAVNK